MQASIWVDIITVHRHCIILARGQAAQAELERLDAELAKFRRLIPTMANQAHRATIQARVDEMARAREAALRKVQQLRGGP